MEYEIKIATKVSDAIGGIRCVFYFSNPILESRSLIIETIERGESTMKFVERIKSYIKSNSFISDVKNKIIKEVEEHNKKEKLKIDVEDVKRELDGLSFSIKVDID